MPEKEAAALAVSFSLKGLAELRKALDDQKTGPEKVLKHMKEDAKKRVPGWIATEVTKAYGVKKGDIAGHKLGRMRVEGKSFKELRFTYTGRLLTPTHFNMSPKAPNPGGAYTLKATFIKGQRTTLGKVKKLTKKQRAALAKNFTRSGEQRSDHSPIMLMPTGTTYIPFQRKSVRRNDVEAIKTLSLPQMVSSDRTEEAIQQAISEGLAKRMEHYTKRYMQ